MPKNVADPVTSYTCNLTPEQSVRLREMLEERGYRFREVPHAHYGAALGKVSLTSYVSGKCVVQGKGTEEFVQFVLEPEILKEARLGYELELEPEQLEERIGIDESGKGDFFGTLCTAAVYVDGTAVRALKDLGVKDSKRITSDKRIDEVAQEIRKVPGVRWEIVPISPPAYNQLHARMGSVNSILGWAHARALENLLEKVPCRKAISDQFARTEWTVRRFLGPLGRQIDLVQRHKAESDYAVAAASVLARDEFVKRLRAMERRSGVKLPKGASDAVITAGRELLARVGEEHLGEYCKMHFKTLEQIRTPR